MRTEKTKGNDESYQELVEMQLDENVKGFDQKVELPSSLQPHQVCRLKFRPEDNPILATVRCVHFSINKVKYDLGLWLGDGTVDNPEYESRIYNVDSMFVTPA